MPAPEHILAGLHAIANDVLPIAIVWHLLASTTIAGVALGWRPTRRVVGMLLALPAASVAVMAWTYGNPFNGAVFTALAATLGFLGLRLPARPLGRAPAWAIALGGLMVVFGLVYPHFVEVESWLTYLYAAPTGLVPCPTLAVMIGIALAADGLGDRGWSLVLAGAGLFYGVFGIARLGVTLDVGLIAGASGLLARAMMLDARR
ncbi:MAG: hypothetical protein AB1806_12240 [Acidobacteriota bacterium]